MRFISYPLILFLLTLLVGSVTSLFLVSYAKPWDAIVDDYLYNVLEFTLMQSLLSGILCLILGLFIARSYVHSTPSRLKYLTEKAMALPFILPTMVMVQILLHMFGHNGWVSLPFSMYSKAGIILTHVILNVPFITYLMRQVWEHIPDEHWRIAKHLGFTSWQFWKFVEWPMVRSHIPHAFIPVFLLCLTSFTPVLILSPDPTCVTLEVGIYQSFMFELDFGNITGLVILQLFIGSIVLFLLPNLLPLRQDKTSFKSKRIEIVSSFEKHCHTGIVYLILLILLMMVWALLEPILDVNILDVYMRSEFLIALLRSTLIACLAGFISTMAALGLLQIPCMQKIQSYLSLLPAFIPTVTLGAGLYIFIGRHFPDLSLTFVVLLNALTGLPFALRILQSSLRNIRTRYTQRITETRMTPQQQWKLVERPLLFPALRLSFALVTAISFGDLGAIILFNSYNTPTLAALMYQYIEALDMQSSACVAFALLVCTSSLFILIQNIGVRDARR